MKKDTRTPAERAADARKKEDEKRLTSAEPDTPPQSVSKPEHSAPGPKSWQKMPPPPPRVIRGSAPLQPRQRVGPIRWAAWLALPCVELWEAVALSMGLNPDDDELRKEVGRARSMFSRLPAEFFERLHLCQRALHFNGPIRPQGSLYGGMQKSPNCLVLLADVAAYLTTSGFALPEQLQPRPPAEPQANRGDSIKREAPAPKPTAAPASAGPAPLTTGDIAFCFAGLQWSEEKWKKPLGDMREWLKTCLVIPGTRGGPARRWDPVCIGAALVRQKEVPLNQVRGRFQSKPALKPWLEAWKTYEADNFCDM
jgi:hypothetical protein